MVKISSNIQFERGCDDQARHEGSTQQRWTARQRGHGSSDRDVNIFCGYKLQKLKPSKFQFGCWSIPSCPGKKAWYQENISLDPLFREDKKFMKSMLQSMLHGSIRGDTEVRSTNYRTDSTNTQAAKAMLKPFLWQSCKKWSRKSHKFSAR